MRISQIFFVILFNLFLTNLFSSDLQDILKMNKVKKINREAQAFIKEKEFDLAREKLNEGFVLEPNSYDLLVTSGKLYFELGDKFSSQKDFKRALDIKPSDPFVLGFISKLNFKEGVFTTKHFVFKKVPEGRKWVINLPLEKSFMEIAEILDGSLNRPIELFFFENEDDFFKEYGLKHLYKKGKLLGASEFHKNRILISSLVKEKEMLSVIKHELVHFFINHKMKNSKLYGIEEGLSNFVGGRKANYKFLGKTGYFKASFLENKKEIGFDNYIFRKLKGVHDYKKHTLLYYEVSTALIEFIYFKKGKKVLKTYINDLMRTDTDYYRLLWASLGYMDKSSFEREFLRFLIDEIRKRSNA